MAHGPDAAARALAATFLRLHPRESAREVDGLSGTDAAAALSREAAPVAAAVFEHLLPETGERMLPLLPEETARAVLERADAERTATVISRLDPEERARRLESLSPSRRQELHFLLAYPETTAARLMESRMPAFRPSTTAQGALSRLRSANVQRVDDLYLVDEEGRLVGAVPLQDVAIAPPGTRLEDLSVTAPVRVKAAAPRDEVLELFGRHQAASLPVVDDGDRLLGVIPNDALVEASQEEVSADIQQMVGVSPEEHVFSTGPFVVRRRLPWLFINLGTAFLAAAVVGVFEDTLARVTALAVLLPIVPGQAGNTGAQTLAVMMRGLALKQVRPSQWSRASFKEVWVAFLNGLAVGAVAGFGVLLWSGSGWMASVIVLSMVCSMTAAALAGVTIPLVLVVLDHDPAQASSIVLTTITDVVGIGSFLGFATIALRLT